MLLAIIVIIGGLLIISLISDSIGKIVDTTEIFENRKRGSGFIALIVCGLITWGIIHWIITPG